MAREITKGMWCLDEDGRVGIASMDDEFEKNGQPKRDGRGMKLQVPTFHVAGEDGTTSLVVYRTWDGLTQATYARIPESRRKGLTRDDFARLGYQ